MASPPRPSSASPAIGWRSEPSIGEVSGRDVIVLDDEIAKGTTVIELIAHLRRENVRSIRVACTHGLFANDAARRILAEPGVEELITTNTAPISEKDRASGLKVLSVAPALAEAIRRIHNGESVSALFA
ncbi:phosphoribosyltransferase family protein [Phenylobacterium sp.]|uniref:phosphoribosyltransferase family protein n=1 Tax=Phenylobacterium sp. TaxID=1871053 RepID=UPI00286DB686|nr:phosphoribosyltransferase family protein [Phenylobacterium sp.]